MPIESFYEMMVIDTKEAAENLVKAFEAAEKRGPFVPEYDIMKVLEEGRKDIPELKKRIEMHREYYERCMVESDLRMAEYEKRMAESEQSKESDSE